MPFPRRVTSGQSNDQLLYFTSSSLTADDSRLIFLSDRSGHPNIFCRDLRTGDERQWTFNDEGFLKSYVYFDGRPYAGLGRASVSLHAESGTAYYLQGRRICAVNGGGPVRVLAEYPAGQMTGFTHISADGRYLCVPTVDARALDDETHFDGKPPYDIDQRVREEGLFSYLRVYDTQTGAEVRCEPLRGGWITHVQFSPADARLILYNNEWPSECGVRRMWLWDGRTHRQLRTEGDGRRREDWTCHEMWMHDGSAIIYHGRYDGGDAYIGRVCADGSELREIALPSGWTRYGHFTMGNGDVLVSDGYYRHDASDTEKHCPWITRLDVDWQHGRIDWTPLCRHDSSWTSQDSHPHPIFNHAGDSIYFTSDREGKRAIHAVPAFI